jgi:hypothetical protein
MMLDNEFQYTGGGILVKLCYHRAGPPGTASSHTFLGIRDAALAFQLNSSYATDFNNMQCGDNTIHPDYSNTVAGNVRPNFRFGINGLTGADFKQATCFHTNKDTIPIGAQHVEILGTKIEIDGKDASPFALLTNMTFDGKTSSITYNGQVINARLYYTGSDSAFSRSQQIGQTININSTNDLNNISFGIPDMLLQTGNHYF